MSIRGGRRINEAEAAVVLRIFTEFAAGKSPRQIARGLNRDGELAKIERRTRKLVELITEDDAPVKALKAELRMLEDRQAEVEKALAVTTTPVPLIHPNLAEVYRQKVATLHEALADPT